MRIVSVTWTIEGLQSSLCAKLTIVEERRRYMTYSELSLSIVFSFSNRGRPPDFRIRVGRRREQFCAKSSFALLST